MTSPAAPDWSDFAALLRAAVVAFGTPESLWEERVIERRESVALRAWLCMLEAIARALLLVMARAMPRLEPRKRQKAPVVQSEPPQRADRDGERRPTPLTTEHDPSSTVGLPVAELRAAERWAGISFPYLPPARRDAVAGGSIPAHRFLPAQRLAFRLEALLRVAADPERYARKLASRHRVERLDVASPLARRLLHRPAPPDEPRFCQEMLSEAQRMAWAALARHGPPSPIS